MNVTRISSQPIEVAEFGRANIIDKLVFLSDIVYYRSACKRGCEIHFQNFSASVDIVLIN